jgi:hypothetical protein
MNSIYRILTRATFFLWATILLSLGRVEDFLAKALGHFFSPGPSWATILLGLGWAGSMLFLAQALGHIWAENAAQMPSFCRIVSENFFVSDNFFGDIFWWGKFQFKIFSQHL